MSLPPGTGLARAAVRAVRRSSAAHIAAPIAAHAKAVDALLSDLGSQLRLAEADPTPRSPRRCPSGIPEIDQLLAGGFPFGRLSEITGPPSSGRTSLALSQLATTTRAGDLVGLIDHADAFDPITAEQAGVDLDRVLWVRARTSEQALRSSERLIKTEGIPLVMLDWTGASSARRARLPTLKTLPTSAWIRLTRLAAGTQTAVLLLTTERMAGSHAELTLEMEPARARFTGTPSMLEVLEIRAMLVRHRMLPVDRSTVFSARALSARAASFSARADSVDSLDSTASDSSFSARADSVDSLDSTASDSSDLSSNLSPRHESAA